MADRPVGEIIQGITDDAKLLVSDTVELAKTELMPSAKNAGIGAGMFGAAGYFGINALTLLYIAAALGLVALGVAPWLAFVIVAAVLLLVAAVLALIGYTRVKKVKSPERTIAQAQESVAEISGAIKRATAAAQAPQIEGRVVNSKALP
jgi:membrane protein implicated in regulation of membrane protease activity